MYELRPRAVAGDDDAFLPRQVAPAHYVYAVQAAVEFLFEVSRFRLCFC